MRMRRRGLQMMSIAFADKKVKILADKDRQHSNKQMIILAAPNHYWQRQ